MDLIEAVKMSIAIQRLIKAAKLIYSDNWEVIKKETLEVIDAYIMSAKRKKSRLSAAIEMASLLNDENKTILLLAAAADE